MSAAHQLFAVVEQGDPFAIPEPPFKYVALPDRIDTYAVLAGSVRIGTVRHDAASGDFVARSNGTEQSAADVRHFTSHEAAARWLSKAVDGVIPRKPWQRRDAA
jgi:hypothetical protein